MFEGYTLADQREFEKQRGWKSEWAALTYCTAEAVVCRSVPDAASFLDWEILDAERISGAPDCLGRRQGKWGTYCRPTDMTPRHAVKRNIKEQFGWEIDLLEIGFAGMFGPWVWKAGAKLDENENLVLQVTEEQMEQTPFLATLFFADATGYELGHGAYLKATKDARWISVRELVSREGDNTGYLYWAMIGAALYSQTQNLLHPDRLILNYPPGEHIIRLQ